MFSNPKISTKIIVSLFIFLLSFSQLLLIEGYNNGSNTPDYNLSTWCKKTPYPKQCEFHLTNNNQYYSFPIKGKSHFLKMIMQNALVNVQRAHQNVHSQVSNCKTQREKLAWKDCLDLYKLSIQHLNDTMFHTNCTQVDAQTWLSSALTLFQTCQNGFNDLGVTKNNIMSNNMYMPNDNVSCLISNALAINGQGSNSGEVFVDPKDGFPKWVRPSDRKLLQSLSSNNRANLVVSQDGSGNYRTIGEAISDASRRNGNGRFVIYIKGGIYNENIVIGSNMKNIMLLGDGIRKTIISGSKSVGGGSTTYSSATVGVEGSGFIAQGITFRNTAGPQNHQAVALRSNADLSVFYKCSFEGYQDTLYAFSNRQFYRDCDIYGTTDFIFGNAAMVIQNCNIYVRFPPAGTNTITAQGRTDPNQNTGISIHNSNINYAEDLKGSKTYLGRPWKMYSRTIFMKTYMSNIIDPKGWLEWSGNIALNTLYYGEYANNGPGSSTLNRVKWAGYHVITSAIEAEKFSVANFIGGNSWLPNTGVPYMSAI